jgi:hypothetical protein
MMKIMILTGAAALMLAAGARTTLSWLSPYIGSRRVAELRLFVP